MSASRTFRQPRRRRSRSGPTSSRTTPRSWTWAGSRSSRIRPARSSGFGSRNRGSEADDADGQARHRALEARGEREIAVGKMTVFDHVSVDGYFAGPHGEIDWFKSIRPDPEYEAFTHQESQGDSTLVFGRNTYEMMKSWWPTPQAIQADPHMAKVVNHSPKLAFSHTPKTVEEGPNWKNVELLHEIDPAALRKRKKESKNGFTILGSGSIVQQFLNQDLIDECTLVIVPVVLGAGKPLFQDVRKESLQLSESRSFKNGLVVLTYTPS